MPQLKINNPLYKNDLHNAPGLTSVSTMNLEQLFKNTPNLNTQVEI